jgi:hypothetical protein
VPALVPALPRIRGTRAPPRRADRRGGRALSRVADGLRPSVPGRRLHRRRHAHARRRGDARGEGRRARPPRRRLAERDAEAEAGGAARLAGGGRQGCVAQPRRRECRDARRAARSRRALPSDACSARPARPARLQGAGEHGRTAGERAGAAGDRRDRAQRRRVDLGAVLPRADRSRRRPGGADSGAERRRLPLPRRRLPVRPPGANGRGPLLPAGGRLAGGGPPVRDGAALPPADGEAARAARGAGRAGAGADEGNPRRQRHRLRLLSRRRLSGGLPSRLGRERA